MRKRTRRQEEPFQMAPMIDMVFLLLVFFMTVSTLAKDSRPETSLPVSETAQVPAEAPPRDVLTLIPDADSSRIFWYNKQVDGKALEGLLEKRGEGSELLLRGPPSLPWKFWKEIFEEIRTAGADEVVLGTFEN
ncbi:biopolymer transporter ExbD [Puniceicoccales bacterium CK1056]|uniref:Biopolymer transporter ExbD n=1 Tax=Oceanipulchritudo coccoides TaxID=2706888 RepID=A0A6B2M1N4_9BACT|nr:biopolymer transporter ExbD [Oceanipulchritudo coccoides]NDV62252.1 biopolymer transporter ExbD [Oceanipulchritudo coccoides]